MTIVVSLTLSLIQSTETQGASIADLLLRASPIAKIVLLLLVLLSLLSWAIIFTKWLALKRDEKATSGFLASFRAKTKLSDLYAEAESLKESPVARIFLAGYEEISNQMSARPGGVHSLDAIGRVLQSATIAEVTRLERSLSWLATTANAAPFIGLFGTVVGIVIAFQGLTTASGSSIQAVAPGIAEALIATAAGIGAAVPAAIFYNYLLSRIKVMTATIDRFTLEMLNLVERNYVKADL